MLCIDQESMINEQNCKCKYALDNTAEKYQCLDLIICQASFKTLKPWQPLLPTNEANETPKNVPMFPILNENTDNSAISLPATSDTIMPP
jgi:hypothetical protein